MHADSAAGLVDVSPMATNAGFVLPVWMTAAAFHDCVRWSDADTARRKLPQEENGRLWDVLWTLRIAIGGGPTLIKRLNRQSLIWTLRRVPLEGPRKPLPVKLKASVATSAAGEGKLTIKKTTED